VLLGKAHGLAAVSRFRDDLPIGTLEHSTQSLSDERMVIGRQDAPSQNESTPPTSTARMLDRLAETQSLVSSRSFPCAGGARAYTPTCHEIGGAKAIAEVRTRVGPVRLAKHVPALVATGSKRDQLGSTVKVAAGDGAEIHLVPKESGAGGGGRTHTTLRSRDFKSRASASFATPA
jgi:hypothetical protein